MKTNIISIVILAVTTLFCLPAFSQITDATLQHAVEYQEDIKYKDFRFAVGGGYAYRVGTVERTNDQVIDDMNKKLRNGFTIDADAQYFFKRTWGLGLNANMSSFSTSGSGFTIPDFDGPIRSYDETKRIIYIGPTYALRHETDKFLLIGTIGLGPIFYADNMTINGVEVNGTQTGLGTNISLAGEYKMSNTLGLGIKLSSTGGSIESLTINGQNVKADQVIGLSNIGVSLYLSFRSW
ncbi:MAG: outer membrane beta-barrel protein [Dysgonamonadaceae bacterium]|nr:outer membrane beta-barrel protein [Dysgonamonadaceae bacterium]